MIRVPVWLQTRLGRRIALLFVISALVPLAVMAVLDYRQEKTRVVNAAWAQVRSTGRSARMSILGQLADADTLLQTVSVYAASGAPLTPAEAAAIARPAFTSLVVERGGVMHALTGPAPTVALSPEQARRVDTGRPTLLLDHSRRVWVVVGREGLRVWGAVDSAYLFKAIGGDEAGGSPDASVCVSSPDPRMDLRCPAVAAQGATVDTSEVIFLSSDFGIPNASNWTVEVSKPLAAVLVPVDAFRRTFFFSLLVVVGWVVLLTSFQVRRNLQPLEELQAGMQRVGQRDFSGIVHVSSGDEFEDLAHTFNDMAGQIDEQFRAITAGSAIDQAALTSNRGVEVAAAAVTRLREALRCRRVDVCIAGDRAGDTWRHVYGLNGSAHLGDNVRPEPRDLTQLRLTSGLQLRGGSGWFAWMDEACADGGPDAVLPLTSHDELLGLIGVHTDGPPSEAQTRLVRQLGDQLSVGLANSRLIDRLNGLSYGALSALARSVDANSHWTAGHSERVTALSMRIARQLQLPDRELDTLYRGGLLHDIGKIGVPNSVLDFAGELDEAGFAAIRKHPELGAKILSPIAAFADAIPIVLSHHERIDGTGYPQRLKGDDIPHLARLLAVADVYDALVSNRPYRGGWASEVAIDRIRASSGRHFDPVMIEAFLQVMAVEGDRARFSVDPISFMGVET